MKSLDESLFERLQNHGLRRRNLVREAIGKPYTFTHYPWMKDMYNETVPPVVSPPVDPMA